MQFNRNANYRLTSARRNLFQETRFNSADFIYPLFLIPGEKQKKEIKTMPDIFQFSLDNILAEIEECLKIGLKSFLLFGVPEEKNVKQVYAKNNFLIKAIEKIKKTFGDEIVLITDICLCSYTDTGHCGIFKNEKLDNDLSIKIFAQMAAAHAEAGADIVAPSAMMDGQVFAIKEALVKNSLKNTLVLSYAAKFASSFYGPFRDAAECAPQFGDRRSYQLPFANSREALNKVKNDIEEGADAIIIKPVLAYLDILKEVKNKFSLPVFAYNVSGEYAIFKNLEEKNPEQAKKLIEEILISIKRAGADAIITYHAKKYLSF